VCLYVLLNDLFHLHFHLIDLIQIDLKSRPKKNLSQIIKKKITRTDRDGREGNFKIDGAWINRGAAEPIIIHSK